jgi:hypothetical protein
MTVPGAYADPQLRDQAVKTFTLLSTIASQMTLGAIDSNAMVDSFLAHINGPAGSFPDAIAVMNLTDDPLVQYGPAVPNAQESTSLVSAGNAVVNTFDYNGLNASSDAITGQGTSVQVIGAWSIISDLAGNSSGVLFAAGALNVSSTAEHGLSMSIANGDPNATAIQVLITQPASGDAYALTGAGILSGVEQMAETNSAEHGLAGPTLNVLSATYTFVSGPSAASILVALVIGITTVVAIASAHLAWSLRHAVRAHNYARANMTLVSVATLNGPAPAGAYSMDSLATQGISTARQNIADGIITIVRHAAGHRGRDLR